MPSPRSVQPHEPTSAPIGRRAVDRLQILSNATSALVSSIEPERILMEVADLTVPALADWCAIDLLEEDGAIRRAGVACADVHHMELARSWWTRFPPGNSPDHWLRRLVAARQGFGIVDVTPEMIARTQNVELRALLEDLGVRQAVSVPIGTRDRTFGALTLVVSQPDRGLSSADAALATELGIRVGVALENARLFAAEKKARLRISKLQQLTAALTTTLTKTDVIEVTCRFGAEAVGADRAHAWLLAEEGILELAAVWNTPDDALAAWRRFPIDASFVARSIFETGERVVLQTKEHQEELSAQAQTDLRKLALETAVALPIRAADEIVGILSFDFNQARVPAADDIAYFETIARHCGQALERARLIEAERRNMAHLALLAKAGEAFSASMDHEATLQSVVEVALPALGDFGFFDVVEGSGVRRIVAAHDDDETLALLQATRWSRSERTDKNLCALTSGSPGIHAHIDRAWREDVAQGPSHLDLLEKLELCSMITVPLRIGGELVGSLTLCHGRSGRHHDAADLALAEEVARRGSVAIAQARLLRSAQDAARRADEAARVKDEFLATVSHELRTPLNAILGWAAIMRTNPRSPSLQKGIEVILRNAQSQAHLIDDILDVSRIITGKLRIEPKPVDMVTIVRHALEVVRPSADARELELALEASTDPILLVADPDRVQQVVWNLLSNAVKFSSPRGRVTIAVTQLGPSVTLSVSDEGKGIEPSFLPYVFDRFRQADSSTTRKYGGLGLGLAIVRHIVELHGGRVEVSSEGAGKGSTFSVTLPVRAVSQVPTVPLHPVDTHAEPDAQEPKKLDLEGLKVLVVDDEPDARELLTLALTSAGADVQAAASVAEALESIRVLRPDVLVSDLGMPGQDGYDLIRSLRALGAAIPSIALTAYTRAEDRKSAVEAGFTTHLGKPVEPSELVRAVANLAALAPRAR